MKTCNIAGCRDNALPGSHWCASHRRLFRQVGGAEPDPLHALIVSATDAHYVLSVAEIAAALGCAVGDVRTHLHALRRVDKARPWLAGPMRMASVSVDSQWK